MKEDFSQTVERIRKGIGDAPLDLAIVLGSGLGSLVEDVEDAQVFSYADLPGLPKTTVAGHAGRIVAGTLKGWKCLLFDGRFHLYEGHSAYQVSAPVRLARALGSPRLLLTCAVGGIRQGFAQGDFLYISDHINMMGDNPLRGLNGSPFIDLSRLYRQDLYHPLKDGIGDLSVELHQGVLAAMMGPSYETPAEIRMMRSLGADVVSMSTVPEAIMAKYLQMEVVGLCLISNLAAGLAPVPLDHGDVLATGQRQRQAFRNLILRLISLWQKNASY